MKRVIKIRQQDSYDCGAATLCAVAAWYGANYSLAEVRKACGCSQDGISLKGLIQGAESLGLSGKAYSSESKDLSPLIEIHSPIIAHITTEEGMYHFVVICRVTAKQVEIMDPAFGDYKKLPYDKFVTQWNGHIILIVPGTGFVKRNEKVSSIRIFTKLAKLNGNDLALAFAGSAALVVAGVSNSLFLQQIIDHSLPEGDSELLLFIAFAVFLLLVLSAYIGYARTLFLVRSGIKIDGRLITGYIKKIFAMPASFFSQYSCGDINARIEDAFKIRTFVTEGIISVFISIMTLFAVFVLMFTYYSKLASMLLLYIPIYLALYYICNKMNKKYSRELAVTGAKFESRTIDSIQGAMAVKHFGAEKLTLNKIEESYVDMARKIHSAGRAVSYISSASDTLSGALLATVLISGAFAVFGKNLTTGELVSFYTLCSLFTSPLNSLMTLNSIVTSATVSAERLFEIMRLNTEEEEQGNLAVKSPALLSEPQDIEVKNLSFSYIGRMELFSNINLTIPKGKITAITGSSGCGKSTLAALFMRDYLPGKGSIEIGGINIRYLQLKEWRDYISIVTQKCSLFNGTILDNITCGEEYPDMELVSSIIGETGLDQMVRRLPMGILTNTGDGGAALSGGELQKISVARVLYKRPEIVIFDESTSSMDENSEKMILRAMLKLREKKKSVIMITHKVKNTDYADMSIDLDQIKCVHKAEAYASFQ